MKARRKTWTNFFLELDLQKVKFEYNKEKAKRRGYPSNRYYVKKELEKNLALLIADMYRQFIKINSGIPPLHELEKMRLRPLLHL